MRIGNDTLLGSVAGLNYGARLLHGATQEAVLTANQKITSVHVGWAPGNGTNSSSVKVCLYDQGAGSPDSRPKIAGTEIEIHYDTTTLGSSPRWISLTGLNIDISAHVGKTLCPGLAPPPIIAGGGFSILYDTVSGAVRRSSNSNLLDDLFISEIVQPDQAFSLYFETETISAGASIDTLGTAGTVRVAATENISTTGLAALTTASVGGKSAASIAATGGDGTITLTDFVDEVFYPAMGTVTTAVGDGSTTASKADTILTTKIGWQYVNVSSLSSAEFSLGKAFGGGDVPTQLHVINDGTGVLNADGTLTNWAVGTYTAWARMAAGTYTAGTMKIFTFTVHAPVDTSGSDLTLSVSFSSPVISQNYIISPHDLSLSTDFSAPDLSQFVLVQPNDFDVAVQLSQPAISAAGYVQIDDFNLAVVFGSPAIIAAANIVVHDWSLAVSLSNPLVGDLPVGPIYADTIVQIIDSKIIVKIY